MFTIDSAGVKIKRGGKDRVINSSWQKSRKEGKITMM